MGRALIGIDPSLSSCGVVVVTENGRALILTLGGKLPKWASEQKQRERVHQIVDGLVGAARIDLVKVAAIEGPAFSRFPNERLAELRGAIRYGLEREGVEVHVVPPSQARKAAFGKSPVHHHGLELKRILLAAVQARGVNAETHDQADAAIVAHYLSLKINGKGLW